MKKTILITVSVGLTALAPLSAHAQFLGKIFGSTKANPGSVLPEWWNETQYNPPVEEGAMHIRLGSAGANGDRYGQIGRDNCDVAYLFAAKTGKPLDPQEREECALLEFYIKRGTDGDNRNVADGFVRREVLAEMSQRIDARIEQFRAPKLFYFRSTAVKVDAYDFATHTTPVTINWYGKSTATADYHFHGRGLDGDRDWMKIALPVDDQTAREVEAARLNSAGSYLALAYNRIIFEVVGAKQVATGGRPTRVIDVIFRDVGFRMMDSQGRAHRISVENRQ